MGVDQLNQRLAPERVPRSQQLEGQRFMFDVTRIDDDVAIAALQHDIVGRQPVAYQHMQLRRQRVDHR